jgi:hypothetical protein
MPPWMSLHGKINCSRRLRRSYHPLTQPAPQLLEQPAERQADEQTHAQWNHPPGRGRAVYPQQTGRQPGGIPGSEDDGKRAQQHTGQLEPDPPGQLWSGELALFIQPHLLAHHRDEDEGDAQRQHRPRQRAGCGGEEKDGNHQHCQ